MDLSVSTREDAGVSVVEVVGEVDLHTAPALREQLHEATSRPASRVVVDLTGVTFLDSTGLGVLVGASGRAKDGDGALRLVVSSDSVRKVLRITGLDAVMPVDPDAAAAVAALRS